MEKYGEVAVELRAFLNIPLGKVSGKLHVPAALCRCPFDRRLGGPQSRSGRDGEEKNSCPCRESKTPLSVRSITTTVTELPRLFIKPLYVMK